jgi:ABC-2 type transport system ATP-binding protein
MILHILLPDSGRIEVLGDSRTAIIRDKIGYLPEERGLYKKMTVRRLLRYYGELKGATRKSVDNAIDRWIDLIELRPWLDKKIEALSKGMSQKVQFVAAVVSQPPLVILDEPFSGLDPINAEVLRDAIAALRADGATIVFSTHDMNVAERMCDRIFMIFRGRKVLDGTLEEIQSAYGSDLVRVRVEASTAALAAVPGVLGVSANGGHQELRFSGDPQALLAALVSRMPVRHFEIARPSLHDIFVGIARPTPEEMEVRSA